MRSNLAVPLVALAFAASTQIAGAQLNVQTEDGDRVTIGPGGISVQKSGAGGSNVNITPFGGVSVQQKQTGKSVDVSTSGINVRNRAKIRTNSTNRTSVTSKAKSQKTTVTTEISLEQQVTSIEIQVYGKKSGGPLLARIEKLEIDNIGKKSTGSLKQRVSALYKAVGMTEPTVASTSTSTTQINVTGATPSVSVTRTGSNANAEVTIGGPLLNLSSLTSGGGIVISSSGQTGTVRCNGEHAIINASNCRLRFQGNLSTLTINGSLNQLALDGVTLITNNGSNNNVTWSTASGAPTVVDNGSNNSLRVR